MGDVRSAGNLPCELSSFIGRERDLAEVGARVSHTRLLTLTGPGGTGKSRLALRAARDAAAAFRDGAWWVELAPLGDPDRVVDTVAGALGVRESPGRAVLDSLTEFVGPRHLLLVLDNCEHLVASCGPLVTHLLRAGDGSCVLTTSRVALGVAGEVVWPVPTLPPPDGEAASTPGAIGDNAAVRLFIDRAGAAVPGFALTADNAQGIADVCRRLDGLPLAIELAAARVRLLTVHQIAERLDDSLRLLTRGGLTQTAHHRTLQAALDWSHDLLTEPQRLLFRRLAVFAGGFTLESAEAVCSGDDLDAAAVMDLLADLVDQSLVSIVQRSEEHDARYRLLEPVRQYAEAMLEGAGERNALRDRHLAQQVAMCAAHRSRPKVPGQVPILDLLEPERGNIRTGVAWAIARGEESLGLRLATGASWLWESRGPLSESRAWLDALLAIPTADTASEVRAEALRTLGRVACAQGDWRAALAAHEACLAVFRTRDDRLGAGLELGNIAVVLTQTRRFSESDATFRESMEVCRQEGNDEGVITALTGLAVNAMEQGDFATAVPHYEEALAICRRTNDLYRAGIALNNLGNVFMDEGDLQKAAGYYEQAMAIWRSLGNNRGLALTIGNLGLAAMYRGDPDAAAVLIAESLGLRRQIGEASGIAIDLLNLSDVEVRRGRPKVAAGLLDECLGLAAMLII